VQRLLGREPTGLDRFLADHSGAFTP
jgi:hypothetical protein